MYREIRVNCLGQFWTWRLEQAQAINHSRLALDAENAESKVWPDPLREFAKALCAMPGKVWKAGKAPDSCVERALGALEEKFGRLDKDNCED